MKRTNTIYIENRYNDLKDKTECLVNNIKKVIDKVPAFIKTIVERLFGSQGMNLNFFIQQYDKDYKIKQENERLKNLIYLEKSKKILLY